MTGVRSWIAPLALCGLAAALRLYRIDAQSLWYDEGISAHQLTRSFAEIARAAALDTHPPLYYWLLKAWGGAVGPTEAGLRSLSAVLGVAAVGLTWLIARDLFGSLAATSAALLLACSPLAVYYGQELRMYTQVVAFGLLATWAYVRRGSWWYVPAAAATLYTQYLGVAFLAALQLHALIRWRSRSRREWLAWAGANAAVLLLFLPWLPVLLDQGANRALNTSPRTGSGVVLQVLAAYGGGVVQEGFLPLLGGGLLVAAGALGALLARRGSGPMVPEADGGVLLALGLWLVPLLLVVALGLRAGLFELRYLLLSVPGLSLLAGLAVARLATGAGRGAPTRWIVAGILLAGLLAPAAVALQRQYFDPRLARDDYRGLARAIQRRGRPGDAVVLVAPNQQEVFSFYYHGPLAVFPLPAQRPIDPRDAERRLEALRAQYGRVWLVSWAVADADPARLIETWLARNGFQASHEWFGGVQLALIALEPSGSDTQRLDLALDNGVDLEGYRLSTRSVAPGDTLALTLIWRAREAPAARWKVFTHLLDAGSRVVAQRDGEPLDGVRPTTSWRAGERLEDHYGLALPADLPAGPYTLEVGMYQESGRRAGFPSAGADHLVLGTVQVTR